MSTYVVTNLSAAYPIGSIALTVDSAYLRLTQIEQSSIDPSLWAGKFELLPPMSPEVNIVLACGLDELAIVAEDIPASVKIAQLNDELRHNLRTPPANNKVVMTLGISRLPHQDIENVLNAISAADIFEEGNDPYGEHDFGSIDTTFAKVFWKIDYFDLNLKYLSPDPADPAKTIRTITIMLSEEY